MSGSGLGCAKTPWQNGWGCHDLGDVAQHGDYVEFGEFPSGLAPDCDPAVLCGAATADGRVPAADYALIADSNGFIPTMFSTRVRL